MTEPTAPRAAAAGLLLERTRAAVDPVLRDAVASLPGRMRLVAGYQLAWWDEHGIPIDASRGKALRPALVLAAARATGGEDTVALPAAAAVELVHNFTLLHDDVMDRDELRRHRPTAWRVFGVNDALLAGDALHALAFRVLADAAASVRLAACVIELCEGQHADCAYESDSAVTLSDCVTMAEAKTGALLGCSAALGAHAAGAPQHQVVQLDAFGRRLGLAFQITDDLLGIWGDPGRTGKPAGADLAVRKKSLPVVAALRSGTPAGEHLRTAYAADSGATPAELAALVEAAGSRRWARTQTTRHREAALALLRHAVPDPAAAAELLIMAYQLTEQSRES
ncbi:polyprenyl synthetase family protein [Kitasatospora sp. NPDC127059]|uniref:polyprenyl synthetase family protein n=1 Tax=unclassified Kitasatospora TaxID=2633591 RepID=UPI003669BA6D